MIEFGQKKAAENDKMQFDRITHQRVDMAKGFSGV
jgi:hypothetical protein